VPKRRFVTTVTPLVARGVRTWEEVRKSGRGRGPAGLMDWLELASAESAMERREREGQGSMERGIPRAEAAMGGLL